MERIIPVFRITSPQGKVTYVVVGYATALTVAVVGGVVANPTVGFTLYSAVVVALIVAGARTFRGADEDPNGKRPRWRMTAKPRAGFVLAGLLTAQGLIVALNPAAGELFAPLHAFAVVFWLGLAGVYLNSSLRLRRRG